MQSKSEIKLLKLLVTNNRCFLLLFYLIQFSSAKNMKLFLSSAIYLVEAESLRRYHVSKIFRTLLTSPGQLFLLLLRKVLDTTLPQLLMLYRPLFLILGQPLYRMLVEVIE
jgi:hypothetical protein